MSLILGEHHTATAEVCTALHNVTGWDGTHLHWNIGRRRKMIVSHYTKGTPRYARNGDPEDYCELSETKDSADRGPEAMRSIIEVRTVPAYDLGYLMRRVPYGTVLTQTPDMRWSASAENAGVGSIVADTPEDAMALLCNALNQPALSTTTR